MKNRTRSPSPYESFPDGSLYRHRRQINYNFDTFGHSILEYLDDLEDIEPNEEAENSELDEKLKSDIKLFAEVIRDVSEKYGQEWGRIADNLANRIKGKKSAIIKMLLQAWRILVVVVIKLGRMTAMPLLMQLRRWIKKPWLII